MRFDLAFRLRGITPSRCAELFFDPRFAQATKAEAGAKSLEELERREEGRRVHRRIRVVPDRTVPAPLRALLRDEVAFVEDSVFDRDALTVEWRSNASVWSDRFELSGKTTFRAAGDEVERRILGELRVRANGVGGMIERLLVADMKETHGRITRLAQRWIDDGW
ncbi:MAG TPA: DUF2505 family protein [Polyangiaceae bacterium]